MRLSPFVLCGVIVLYAAGVDSLRTTIMSFRFSRFGRSLSSRRSMGSNPNVEGARNARGNNGDIIGGGNGGDDGNSGEPPGRRSQGEEAPNDDGQFYAVLYAASRRRKNQNFTRRYQSNDSNSVTNFMIILLVAIFILQNINPSLIYAGNFLCISISCTGEYYRILTPIFLHGDMLHLLFNCMSLGNIAPAVEGRFGPRRFTTVFLLSGVAGNLFSYVKMPKKMSVGASGSIFGLIGALAVFLRRNEHVFGDRSRRGLASIQQTVLINVLYGAASKRIDNWGHFGGFLGGALYSYLAGPRYEYTMRRGQWVLIDRPLLSEEYLSTTSRKLKKYLKQRISGKRVSLSDGGNFDQIS